MPSADAFLGCERRPIGRVRVAGLGGCREGPRVRSGEEGRVCLRPHAVGITHRVAVVLLLEQVVGNDVERLLRKADE
eukprot:5264477-Prymnesium_polylepis.1